MKRFRAAAHHFRRVRRPQVQGHRVPEGLGEGFPQLADVAVRFAAAVQGAAGKGQDSRYPCLLQGLIILAAQPAVDQYDFASGLLQVRGQHIFRVVECSVQPFCRGGAGTLVAGDFILLFIGFGDLQPGVLHAPAGHGKFLQVRRYARPLDFLQQPLGHCPLLRGAAYPLISQLPQKPECPMRRYMHIPMPSFISYGCHDYSTASPGSAASGRKK